MKDEINDQPNSESSDETPEERSAKADARRKSIVELFRSHGIDSADDTEEHLGSTSIWLRFGPLNAPEKPDDRSETLMRNLQRRGGR